MTEYIYEITTDSDGVDCYIKRGEIVRCKDCKHRKDKKTGYECRIMNADGTKYPSGNDFCSYGERK